MKAMTRKKYIISLLIIALITVLWLTRIFPSVLSILTATKYVKDKYPDKNFEYIFVEYSSAHGDCFVYFVDKNDNKIVIMTSPFRVMYDPLNQPR